MKDLFNLAEAFRCVCGGGAGTARKDDLLFLSKNDKRLRFCCSKPTLKDN